MSLYLSYILFLIPDFFLLFGIMGAVLDIKKIRYNLMYVKIDSIDKHLGLYIRYNSLQGTENTVPSISL